MYNLNKGHDTQQNTCVASNFMSKMNNPQYNIIIQLNHLMNSWKQLVRENLDHIKSVLRHIREIKCILLMMRNVYLIKYISRVRYLATFEIFKGPLWKKEIVYLFIYLCRYTIFIPLLPATLQDAFSPFSYACLGKI